MNYRIESWKDAATGKYFARVEGLDDDRVLYVTPKGRATLDAAEKEAGQWARTHQFRQGEAA